MNVTSRRGTIIAHTWLFGGGITGFVGALAVYFTVPVASETIGAVLGGAGVLIGCVVGGVIGIDHEDRYERRRLGLGEEVSHG